MAGDNSIMSVNRSLLAELDVLSLRFSNLEFGLQILRLGHASEACSGCDLLADFHLHLLQDTVGPRQHSQGLRLRSLEFKQRPELRNACLLRGQLRLSCLDINFQPLLFDTVTVG